MELFLPINKKDMLDRGWDELDFIIVSGDAYIDHPSFGVAIISRILEAFNYKVGIIAQPNIKDVNEFKKLGTPRLGFMVTGGNIDSMVSHYSVARRRRKFDYYTPGGKMGKRPDDAVITYSRIIRKLYPDTPIILGGIEASLRRLCHYDYYLDKLRPSILIDSQADIILYGMADKSVIELADALKYGINIKDLTYLRGSSFLTTKKNVIDSEAIFLPKYNELLKDKLNYAKSFKVQYLNSDPYSAKTLVEEYNEGYVVVNPPAYPLTNDEIDWVYNLNYERKVHPSYKEEVKAISEVKHSIIINRGCYGNCSFCALNMHQGRIIQSRSKDSVINEAHKIIKSPDFKGYIHDVGGPTANFYHPSCKKATKQGMCLNRNCLTPKPCPNLRVSHQDYLDILKDLRKLDGVKKVFVRSGIRYDYLIYDQDETFFNELVKHHVSGQLKVAPEHISDNVLRLMNKPSKHVFCMFMNKFYKLNKKHNKEQYIIPYFMSSHPGSTLKDAVELAEFIHKHNLYVEQVQDFYPTPSTLATCMFYTGVNPLTNEKVYVATSPHEKALQRALIHYKNPKNYHHVIKALKLTKREDLIGYHPHCLVKPKKAPKKVTN